MRPDEPNPGNWLGNMIGVMIFLAAAYAVSYFIFDFNPIDLVM